MADTGRRSMAGGKNMSSQLIGIAVDLMASYDRSAKLNNPRYLSNLCFSIARGIDHAIANNEFPLKVRCLPQFLLKIDVWKHDMDALIPFMMLMMSIKTACKIGWFQKKESDDLLLLASEVQRLFCTDGVVDKPYDALPLISIIMSRFYPNLKIKNTLSTIEVEPGFRTAMVEFNLLRGMVAPRRETIGIIVARVDDMDTSSCIITPQEVNIMLNGIGVPGRNNTSMEGGPQLPTDVTAMIKHGVNLFQAIGNFDGRYIIVIAIMSVIPSSDTTQLQDYVQPTVASGDLAIHGQQLQLQGIGGTQASHTTQKIQPSVLVPPTKQLRTGDKKQSMHEKTNPLSRKDGLVELPSKDWRPHGRMRGSLQGQAYSEAYNRIIGQPTQPVRASEPPSRLVATFSVASQMPGIKSNSQYVQACGQPKTQTSTGNATNLESSAD